MRPIPAPRHLRTSAVPREVDGRRLSGYIGQVRTAKLSDVKNDLSRIVEEVRRGGRVRILVRGVAAADIVPIESAPTDYAEDMAALERSGSIRRGKAGLAAEILKAGPRVDERRSKRILSEERDDRA